jgi:hypothetical protein
MNCINAAIPQRRYHQGKTQFANEPGVQWGNLLAQKLATCTMAAGGGIHLNDACINLE